VQRRYEDMSDGMYDYKMGEKCTIRVRGQVKVHYPSHSKCRKTALPRAHSTIPRVLVHIMQIKILSHWSCLSVQVVSSLDIYARGALRA